MNSTTINKYQIVFENRIQNRKEAGKVVSKSVNINNWHLGSFLTSWNKPEVISELLLPDIYNALNGVANEIENGSETISILIYQDRVDFYPEDDSSFSIPTLDFKEIVEGWRDFLLQPPVNGAKA